MNRLMPALDFEMYIMKKLLQGVELEQRAKKLGVPIEGMPRTHSISGKTPRADDYELQKRVRDAERNIREQRLWIIAVISSIASVASAITALVAVLLN